MFPSIRRVPEFRRRLGIGSSYPRTHIKPVDRLENEDRYIEAGY